MDSRAPELHVSALSPPEFRVYSRYLDLLALAQARSGDSGVDSDGTVRFDRNVLVDFATDRLRVSATVVDDTLDRIAPATAQDSRLVAGQVYAVLRVLAHVTESKDLNELPKSIGSELVFLPAEPLPLDPDTPAVAPPVPRRLSAKGTARSPPQVPAKSPSLSRRASSSVQRAPSPPPRVTTSRAAARQSLPASYGLDPFRDTASPSGSPSKVRTYSAGAAANFGNTNPFRSGIASQPSIDPLDDAETNISPTRGVGPPLPPRKPSIKRPDPKRLAPSLPPRYSGPTDSSSNESWTAVKTGPTSTTAPSGLMQQSLAAAAAGASVRSRRSRDDVVLEVIKSSGTGDADGDSESSLPAPPVGGARSAPQNSGRDSRRDLRDTVNQVTQAVRASGVDGPPPPPQRKVAPSRPNTHTTNLTPNSSSPAPRPATFSTAATTQTTTSSSARPTFHATAAQYRDQHPSLKTWTFGNLLTDRPAGRQHYALIILNQPVTRRDTLFRAWSAAALRYCADGGANRLYDALDPDERAGLLPTMIKGDLDSIRPDVKAFYTAKGVTIRRDRSEYSTDLQKCMEEVEAVENASGKRFSLLLYGGLSGRVDQTVHVMSFVHKLRRARPDTYVISEDSLAWVLDKGAHVVEIDHAAMGQTCGILPVGVTEAEVTTSGLKWDLDGPTGFDGLVSSSNHLLPSEPAVFLHTSAPVFWTIELKPGLPMPVRPTSHSDEVARGVKEIGQGIVRAAEGVGKTVGTVGRRLSRPAVGATSGAGINGEWAGLVQSERGERRDADRERDGRDDDDEGGYAQLD